MKTATIKNTDLHVSMFGLGDQSFGSRDDKTVSYAMLDQFVDGGGNFLDTSNNYAIWNGQGGEIQRQYRHPDSDARKATLFQIAEEIGATPNQVILAWLTGRGVIPISGASRAHQMSESLIGFDLTLSDEILDRLDATGADNG